MRAGPAGGVVASAIFGVALLVARTLAAKIARNPDPFPLGRLAREPDGAEVCIARPGGTVLRALVAGKGPTAVLATAMAAPSQHGTSCGTRWWRAVTESSPSTSGAMGAPRSVLLAPVRKRWQRIVLLCWITSMCVTAC